MTITVTPNRLSLSIYRTYYLSIYRTSTSYYYYHTDDTSSYCCVTLCCRCVGESESSPSTATVPQVPSTGAIPLHKSAVQCGLSQDRQQLPKLVTKELLFEDKLF